MSARGRSFMFTNPALALYNRMGFRERARPWVIWRWPETGL
jgi:hypothetical protein